MEMASQQLCELHNQPIIMFCTWEKCESNDKFACSDCLMKTHSNHKFIHINIANEQFLQVQKEYQSEIKELQQMPGYHNKKEKDITITLLKNIKEANLQFQSLKNQSEQLLLNKVEEFYKKESLLQDDNVFNQQYQDITQVQNESHKKQIIDIILKQSQNLSQGETPSSSILSGYLEKEQINNKKIESFNSFIEEQVQYLYQQCQQVFDNIQTRIEEMNQENQQNWVNIEEYRGQIGYKYDLFEQVHWFDFSKKDPDIIIGSLTSLKLFRVNLKDNSTQIRDIKLQSYCRVIYHLEDNQFILGCDNGDVFIYDWQENQQQSRLQLVQQFKSAINNIIIFNATDYKGFLVSVWNEKKGKKDQNQLFLFNYSEDLQKYILHCELNIQNNKLGLDTISIYKKSEEETYAIVGSQNYFAIFDLSNKNAIKYEPIYYQNDIQYIKRFLVLSEAKQILIFHEFHDSCFKLYEIQDNLQNINLISEYYPVTKQVEVLNKSQEIGRDRNDSDLESIISTASKSIPDIKLFPDLKKSQALNYKVNQKTIIKSVCSFNNGSYFSTANQIGELKIYKINKRNNKIQFIKDSQVHSHFIMQTKVYKYTGQLVTCGGDGKIIVHI